MFFNQINFNLNPNPAQAQNDAANEEIHEDHELEKLSPRNLV